MAVAYVGFATHDDGSGGTGGSWNHSSTGATDNALIVGIQYGDTVPASPPTVTVNAVSATLEESNVSPTAHRTFVYSRTNVASGTIPVAYSEGGDFETFGTSVEVSGVDQTTPVRDGNSSGGTTSGTPITVEVTSAADDLALCFVAFNSTPTAIGGSETSIHSTSASDHWGASRLAGASPSVTFSRTPAGSAGNYSMVAVSLQPPATGGGSFQPAWAAYSNVILTTGQAA